MTGYYFNYVKQRSDIEYFFESMSPKIERIELEDPRSDEPGAFIFIHTKVSEDWVRKAECNRHTNYIFMSRHPGDLDIDASRSPNIYICEFSADKLHESEQIKILIEQLNKGDLPDWNLLKSRIAPEVLVAAYVLLLAKREGRPSADQLSTLFEPSDLWQLAGEVVGEEAPQLPSSWQEFAALEGANLAAAIEQSKACLKRIAT